MSTSQYIAFDDDVTFCVFGAYGDSHAETFGAVSTGFTGAPRQHELGWYLLGDRFYLPWLRRFICTDSLSPFGPGGFNRYGYCLGDPINRIDPSGHASWKWLGTLLGKMGGAIGKGVETVSQVTPTMALKEIATVMNVVAVATGIGAVAAAALDEAPTAGILGWVAAGSGLGGLGTSMGGLGKSRARTNPRLGSPLASYMPLLPGRSSTSFKATIDGESTIFKIKTTHGASAVRAANRTVRDKTKRHPKSVQPGWSEGANASGGINHVVDTTIESDDLRNYMEVIRNRDAGDPYRAALPITILTGVHGTPRGYNWKRTGLRGKRDKGFVTQDEAYKESMAYDAGRTGADWTTKIEIHDISGIQQKDFIALMEREAHIVHAYCFSAADHEVMKQLRTTAVSVYSV